VAKFGLVGIIAFFITLGGANVLHYGAGLGPLTQLGIVAAVRYGLGVDDKLSYNVSNIIGIGVATIFRLYCYRRWVFLVADGTPLPEQLEPETSDR
jgi:putative flippase GtrA